MKAVHAARLVLCAAALSPAALLRADDKPVSLARTVKTGDVTRFKTTITASVGGMDIQVIQESHQKVKDVRSNGEVVLEITNDGGKVSVAGMDTEIPASPPVEVTQDKLGKLVKFTAPAEAQTIMSPEVQQVLASLSSVIYPEKAVAEKAEWQTELDNPVVKTKKYTIKSSYGGTDKVDGKDLWKVKQTAVIDVEDGGKIVYENTSWLDTSTGQPIKTEGSIKDLPTMYGPMTMSVKTARVPEAAKDAKP